MATLIVTIHGLGVLYFASDLFVPIVIALLSCLSLRPMTAKLCGVGSPQAAASGLVIVGLFTTLGVAVTLVMWLLGMPTPVLWGVLATLFNFIPYVGPLAATAVVFLAASTAFDTVGRAGFTAIAFWLTTAVEGQFVTPSILGKTLQVGPVVVLIAVAFWGFIWGLPGVFLAVPLLIVLRKVLASFEATYSLAVVLGESPCNRGQDCEPIQEDQPIAEMA